MEDQLITFSTAKLAKEKGFNEYCKFLYNKDGTDTKPCSDEFSSSFTHNNEGIDKYIEFRKELQQKALQKGSGYIYDSDCSYTCCTQNLLQRWLREKHGIYVLIHLDITLFWEYGIGSLYPEASYTGNHIQSNYVYSTYELALEAGLLEALKLIKVITK